MHLSFARVFALHFLINFGNYCKIEKFKALGNAVIDVLTVINKRKDHVYFFNDTETDYVIDDGLF